jgi:hypothetical protein
LGSSKKIFYYPFFVIHHKKIKMGSGASAIPDELDFEACVKVSNEKISKEIFDQFKNEAGFFPKSKLIELSKKTDCFLTHDWYEQ